VKLHKTALFGLLIIFLTPTVVMAQGFGEYGRSLGGAIQRESGVNSDTPSGSPQGGKAFPKEWVIWTDILSDRD
jgi:hypothetical protein